MDAGILSILLIFGFIPLLAFSFVLLLVLGGWRRSRGGRQRESEEIRWMQEMFEGMTRLGERVEALETLLMEDKGKSEQRERASRFDR